MSMHDDPLDRALRSAVIEPPAAEDDLRWMARAMGAVGAAEAAAPEVEGQLLDETRAVEALEALLAPPCPDGSVDGEPRVTDDLGASDLDEPWRADEEAEDAARDDHGAIASHASDHAQQPRHLQRISLHDAELPRAPLPSETPEAQSSRRRNGGWIAGLALAAAALLGVFAIGLREDRRAAAPERASQPSSGDVNDRREPKAVDTIAIATATATANASASAAPTVAMIERPTATAGDTLVSPSKTGSIPPPPKPYLTLPVGTAMPQATAAPPATATATATATAPPPYVADRPEPMDVRSAVNFRMAAADACVVGMAGESKVTITFGPSGTVTGVIVTDGPAKGTGAEACIKKAFSTARVEASRLGGTGYAVVTDAH
jgi:hypothetical protein